jgi:UDP-3-O-[3-hydroxymyristoyl] glucosamine N-acyltransferase
MISMPVFFKLSELLQFLKKKKLLNKKPIGNIGTDITIEGFSSIYDTKSNTLSRIGTQSIDWSTIKCSVILCPTEAEIPENTDIVFIPVDNPRNTFAQVIYYFYPQNISKGISPTAMFGDDCKIGENVFIGHHVVIGDNVKIGNNTRIYNNVTLYDNVTIGSNCIIHSGAVIGTEAFGYYKKPDGGYFKFPHMCGVVIEDNVEIGSNTCIARGKLIDTLIKKNVKIGNLSHISHDVIVEENTLITHQVHLGGNTRIKSNSWISPDVSLMQGITIGENTLVGMGAVVLKDVKAFDTVAGIPAKSIKKNTTK